MVKFSKSALLLNHIDCGLSFDPAKTNRCSKKVTELGYLFVVVFKTGEGEPDNDGVYNVQLV